MITLTKDSDIVILRSPEWGNTETYDDHVLINETRGGIIKVFRDSNWITERRFNFTITTLTGTVIDSFRTFIKNHIGERISITDHLNNDYVGYILTDIFDIVTVRDDCSYDISFEFIIDESLESQFYRIIQNDEDRLTEDGDNRALETL